jgi:hypothetical protein
LAWIIRFEDEFEEEFQLLPLTVSEAVLADTRLLGRPHVDTLEGSKFANMKKLRLTAAGGAWRVAFAFDPTRRGILLVAGGKSGVSEPRFYRNLIAIADKRYAAHLQQLTGTPPD